MAPGDGSIAAAASERTLSDAAVSGVRWTLGGRMIAEVVALAAAIVLARMIPPAEFGRAAVALTIAPLAVILTFEAFGAVLVQRAELSEEQTRTAVFMSLAGGTLLCVGALALNYVLVRPHVNDEVSDLLAIACPLFLLGGIAAVPRALLMRGLRFGVLSAIEVTALLVGAVTAVACAINGMDGEAIILGAVATGVAMTIGQLIAARPPRPLWRIGHARDGASFGLPAAIAGLMHVGFTNVDYAIVAARVSAGQAGLYWRAFQLGVAYQDKVSGIMLRLAFPLYSRTKSLEELRRFHGRVARLHAAVVFPLLGLLVVTAPVLVPWMFGDQWVGSVVPTQILAIAGMAAAGLAGYPQVLLAAGKPKVLLRFHTGAFVTYATAVAIAAGSGTRAVCWTVAGVYVGMLVVAYGVLLPRHVGMAFDRLFKDFGPALGACAPLIGVGWLLQGTLEGSSLPDAVQLVIIATASLAIYGLTLRVVFGRLWAEVVDGIRRVLPSRGNPPVIVATAAPGPAVAGPG